MLQPANFPGKKLNLPIDAMIANVRKNVLRPGAWWKGTPKPHKRVVCLIGGGPSLHEDMDNIRSRHRRGQEIWALNGSHDFLLNKGITPHTHVILDARAENVAFVQNPQKGVRYLINAMCDPSVFNALEGYDVQLWFHAMHDPRQDEAVAEGLKVDPDRWFGYIEGGSTVGLRAMGLAYGDGCRKVHLYGYDSSYLTGPDNKPIGVTNGHAYPQPLNDRDKDRLVDIHANGRIYWATPWMASQVTQMQHWAPLFEEAGMAVFFHGRGLMQWVMQSRTAFEYLSVEETERQKWLAYWKDDANRGKDVSATVKRIQTYVPVSKGQTVIDYGCGEGLVGLALANLGAHVTGIDFAANSMSPEAAGKISIHHEALWMIPERERAALGICRGVLDHIPPHRLDDTLAAMSRTAEVVYFEEDAKYLPAIKRAFSHAHDINNHIQAINLDQPNMTAIYDLSVSPPTYDFFSFLLAAENRRILNRFPMHGGIDLVIVQGPDRGFRIDDNLPRDVDMRRMMLQNVILSGAQLCASVKSIRWVQKGEAFPMSTVTFPNDWKADDPSRHYGLKVQVQNMKFPGTLRAPEWARDYVDRKFGPEPFVTFTLRTAKHWPERNSNRDEWLSAARIIRQQMKVLWLDDTEEGGGDFPEAFNPALRMALYERAVDNYGVNNGPMWLALTNCDVRAWVLRVAENEYATTNPEFFEQMGLPKGSQPRNPNHRLIWGPDTADAIVSAFHERIQNVRAA